MLSLHKYGQNWGQLNHFHPSIIKGNYFATSVEIIQVEVLIDRGLFPPEEGMETLLALSSVLLLLFINFLEE